MAELALINNSTREFTDISSEGHRQYTLANGMHLDIPNPQWLSVSESGNHYVVDTHGQVYVIPPGWLLLTWLARPGEPHLVA